MPRVTKNFLAAEKILAENKASAMTGVPPRDSDTELYIQFLQRYLGCQLTEQQMELMRSVNYESISRARRKLQENGQYMPSPMVWRRRRLKGWELQQVAPKESAGGIQRRIEENDA